MHKPSALILAAAGLALLFACSTSEQSPGRPLGDVENASWPIFRGDAAMSGVARDPIPDKLDLLWSFDTGAVIVSSPVIGHGRIYIGSTNGGVFALDLGDGRKVWEFFSDDDIEASPLILEESLYIGNLSGE
ncbi:MAG: PQQ-binding-like beta-propeller repeat protein, partial [Candidatus Aminicenantaceae bacterium]